MMGDNSGALPRCLCCDRPLSPVAQHGGLCYGCLDADIAEQFAMRDGTVEDVKARVAWLLDQGCPTLARMVMGGVLPFERVG